MIKPTRRNESRQNSPRGYDIFPKKQSGIVAPLLNVNSSNYSFSQLDLAKSGSWRPKVCSRPHVSCVGNGRIGSRSQASSCAPHTRLCAQANVGSCGSSAIHRCESTSGGSLLRKGQKLRPTLPVNAAYHLATFQAGCDAAMKSSLLGKANLAPIGK